MKSRTVDQAVNADLAEIERRLPDAIRLFRAEYDRLLAADGEEWKDFSETGTTVGIGDLLKRIKQVLTSLPKPKALPRKKVNENK